MKLIATIGANTLTRKHNYTIGDKEYQEYVSFLALAKAFDIDDIVLIGTNESKNSVDELLQENKNIKMVVIESDDVKTVFQESLNHISKDTILDLTQGFRHYPMLTLLASVFLQNVPQKNIKDIFYAQILDNNCKPYESSCDYEFVSLIHYLDIANMAKIINTFQNTLIVADYEVLDEKFKSIVKDLEKLSKAMFSNNFEDAKSYASKAKETLNQIITERKLPYMDKHLEDLKKELKLIQNLTRYKESQTLLNVSEYFLKKDIFLHSITVLYEAMVAFLDEKISDKECETYKRKSDGKTVKANTYKRRNCLKLKLRCKSATNIINCKEFSRILRKVDELRNISAHAFTSDTHSKDIEEEIKKYIKELRPILSS